MEEESVYNEIQSKFCASLLWFVCRISERKTLNSLPAEITNPIDVSKDGILVQPSIVEYLTHGQLYFDVACIVFQQDVNSFFELMQFMSEKSLYVVDQDTDEAITHHDVMQENPFKIHAHLALMDALTFAYVDTIISTDDLIASVRRFSLFNASKEFPFDLESGLLLWLNKVNQANTLKMTKSPHTRLVGDGERVRLPKNQLIEKKVFPRVARLKDALCDGKTLLSIVLFYFDEHVNIEDIHLSRNLCDEEIISNIELFRNLCAAHICTSVFALRIEDFYVANDSMRTNFIALLAEMFAKVESIARKNKSLANPHSERLDNNKVAITSQQQQGDAQHQQQQQQHHHQQQHRQQPLLSKRCKQQFAIFETTSSNTGKSSDVVVNDFESKQSFKVPSTSVAVEKMADTERSIAWTPQETKKKSSKISLQFKSDMGAMQPTLRPFRNEPREGEHDPGPDFRIDAGQNLNVENIDQSKHDVEWDDEAMLSSVSSRDHRLVNDARSRVEKDNLYSLVANELLLSAQHEKQDERHADNNDKQNDDNFDFDKNNDDDDDDDDDALSTITEATEPEHGYSQGVTDSAPFTERQLSSTDFYTQNASLTLESNNTSCRRSVSDDAPSTPKLLLPSDICVREENAPSSQKLLLPSDLRESKPSLDVDCKFATSSHHGIDENQYMSPFNSIVTAAADTSVQRTSYVIDQRSVEHAMASGLPVISNEPDMKNVRSGNMRYRELVNSSREISAMQCERVPPSVEVLGDCSLVETSLKSSRVVEQEKNTLYQIEHVDSSQKSQSQPSVVKEPEVEATLLTTRNNNLKTTQNNSLADLRVENVENGVSSCPNKFIDIKGRDIFHSVSYRHWPFVRKDMTNTITLTKDGRQVVYEKLHATESPGYTSWADLSTKRAPTAETPAISLEEREKRLRNIIERRQNNTETNRVTTTWAQLSQQNREPPEGEMK